MFMPDVESISNISLIGVLFIIPITLVYLYVSVKNKGMVRTKALYIFFGIWVTFIGMLISIVFTPSRDLDGWFTSIGISSIVIIIGSVLIFNGFKLIVPEGEEIEESDIKLIKTLGLDIHRPANITEEEVSISKEKKICLVCKSKISGHTYVCPECETFYCDKCYNALTNLENACWACNTQLDESKPVKPYNKEDEIEPEVETSEKPHKKPKTEK